MSMNFNRQIFGLKKTLSDADYQTLLNKKAGDILGDKDSISMNALKNNSVFAQSYGQLDDAAKARFANIANLDGDESNISEKELKVLLTFMDADLKTIDGREKFVMDGEDSVGKSGGLNQATDKEIKDIHDSMKTRDEMAKSDAIINKTKNETADLQPYDKEGKVNGGEWAKAFQVIFDNIDWGSPEGLENWNKAFESILGQGQVVHTDSYRDGGSKSWLLQDGTEVFFDNQLFGRENGYVTVRHPDQSTEKFDPTGKKVE